jgi:hypothetical protein
MISMAWILTSALSVACSAAMPSATENGVTATPIPLMESPVQPSPAPPERPTEAATAVPPGTITLSPKIMVPTEPPPMPAPESGAPVGGATADNPAVVAAREALAGRLQVAPAAIRVIAVEEVQWPDGCLGVRTPGVFCIQVIVPGYRVTLEGNSRRYVYHTDREGRQVILAEPRP